MNPINTEQDKKIKEPVKICRIFFVTISANLSTFSAGTTFGWTSPIIPKLISKASDSPLNYAIDVEDVAWITSIISIGACIAPFVGGPLANKFGRKPVLLYGSIFFILGYILLLFANKAWIIIFARFIQGLGVGIVYFIIPIYVGEISLDKVRGPALSLITPCGIVGLFYAYCIGPYVSYKTLQYFCLIVPILFISIFSFMPESPIYFIEQNEILRAKQSLQFLRGQSAEGIKDELSIMEIMVANSKSDHSNISELVRKPSNRKALFICVGLIILQQASGINAIIFNSQMIFEKADINFEPHIATIIVGAVQLVSALLAPISTYYLPRRLLLLASSVFMTVGLTALGVCFYYFEVEKKSSTAIMWLPVPATILYMVFYTMWFNPIRYTLLGEMFSPHVKTIAISFGISISWLSGFFVTLLYPIVAEHGTFYAFWSYALVCVISFFFVYFIVFETKGLSLQEIQNKLENKK